MTVQFDAIVIGTGQAGPALAARLSTAGMPLTLTADARYSGEKLTIRKGQLRLHTLDLATAGDIQFGNGAFLNLSVDSKPASLEGWDKIVPAIASYQLAGTLELQAKVRGKMDKGAVPEVQGVLSLKKASAKPPDFPKPIENLDTRINFTGQKADISDMKLSLGKSRIQLAAAIQRFAPLTLTYKMSTAELWPADYSASLGEERKADVIRNLRSEGQFAMEHLQKTIWPEAYAPANAGVNGDFDTTVMRPFATVCLSRGSREGWLQRGKASRTFNRPFKRMQFPTAKISSESGNSYG